MISAVIITLNEERNIERCLRSLLNVADEIIVMDSYSTDRTQEICEKFKVHFIQSEWKGYSATKNKANAMASHPYILSIDADEALSKELQTSIRHEKQQLRGVCYSSNRLTNYCGSWIYHCGWYPDIKVRIFPKDKVKWTGDYVHEVLDIPADLDIRQLQGNILHFSYYDKKDHRQRADKYSLLTAQKLHAKNKQVGFLKPYLSAIGKFINVYFLKRGFLDGKAGFNIAWISARSNIVKYKELRRLNHEGR